MLLARSVSAVDPRRFGRGPVKDTGEAVAAPSMSDDLKLFLTTFAAGFIFVSVFFG